MARFFATLGLLLAIHQAASAQFFVGPPGYYSQYGYSGGLGFGYSGRHFAFGGYWTGGYSYSYYSQPYFPPAYYGYPVPVIVVPSTIVVRPVLPYAKPNLDGGVGLAGRIADPQPPARVDPADFVVVKPGKEVVRVAGAAVPAPNAEPPKIPEVEQPPKDPVGLARFEINRAKAAFERGQYGLATERLQAAMLATPEDALPRFLMVQVRTARGQYAEAVSAIVEGLARSRDWPAGKFNLQEIYGKNAVKFDEHLEELKKAATAEPENPALGFLLGYHLWFLGEKAHAVKHFRKASAQSKDNAPIERFLTEAEG